MRETAYSVEKNIDPSRYDEEILKERIPRLATSLFRRGAKAAFCNVFRRFPRAFRFVNSLETAVFRFLLVSTPSFPYIAGIEDCERLCLRAFSARQISFNVDIPAVECLGGKPND
ncbi:MULTISPECIES: hypothetical protein [Rhizobium/Agrobacterium group]|uniref:hypothetical protein n=1 Tax=Rhizobium/Agrobacterium group TaxID=227290 RepID=UPI00083CFBBC|nr:MULTISPECIES: hypothetical protein [Rhizobium/Agrobacterium group]MDM7982613.1 hypothetical protein [Rhizobium sp.]MDM8014451.1 hypothetical protein [Rhizobium sp.]QGG89781.1 hypothetical protein GH983_04550 [Agrobacterium sp. MA01]